MEHRHGRRKNLFLYLDIIDRHNGHLLGHVGDLSEDGLLIISEHKLAVGTQLDVQIKLPDGEGFSKTRLDLSVEVRWAKPDLNPDLQCIGCQFTKLDENDLPLIEQVAQLLSFDG